MDTTLPAGSAPPDPTITRAQVDAGAVQTRYARAGTGAPVVLLAPVPDGDAADPLVAGLARGFRVVAPEAPRLADTAFSAWLRGFLDGLGLARVSLVAREAYALRALGFSITDPLRVDRLALLYADCGDPAITAAPEPERLGYSGHPLLVHCASGCGDGSADAIARFLRD